MAHCVHFIFFCTFSNTVNGCYIYSYKMLYSIFYYSYKMLYSIHIKCIEFGIAIGRQSTKRTGYISIFETNNNIYD